MYTLISDLIRIRASKYKLLKGTNNNTTIFNILQQQLLVMVYNI